MNDQSPSPIVGSVPDAVSSTGVPNSSSPGSRTINDPKPDLVRRSVSKPSTARRAQVVPERGSGEFDVASGGSPVVGSGTRVTYQVEVENGIPLRAARVARRVDTVLADPRGWTAAGEHALSRVDADGDLRILIATPTTTDRLCAPLSTGGRLSCRNGNLVVLNAWRWMNGAASYDRDLAGYQTYLINHEVGHALGNAHESCPGAGESAPVMLQQTKGLDSCVSNPWPTS
ncbi:MAG: DUF3152 domain-containing protein [Nocardioides sp.]